MLSLSFQPLEQDRGSARGVYSSHLEVTAPNREKYQPAMQRELLAKMAELSGGRYLTVPQLPALIGLLEGKERVVIERKEHDLWDVWPAYVLLMLCAAQPPTCPRRSSRPLAPRNPTRLPLADEPNAIGVPNSIGTQLVSTRLSVRPPRPFDLLDRESLLGPPAAGGEKGPPGKEACRPAVRRGVAAVNASGAGGCRCFG